MKMNDGLVRPNDRDKWSIAMVFYVAGRKTIFNLNILIPFYLANLLGIWQTSSSYSQPFKAVTT